MSEVVKPKIGFHTASAGNATGIGDYIRSLDQAGIPAVVCCADGTTGLSDAVALIEQGSDVPHVLMWRRVVGPESNGNVEHYSVPKYGLPPVQAASDHWEMILRSNIPNEVRIHRDKVWILPINEVRPTPDPDQPCYENMHPGEWLGLFSMALADIANAQGYKVAMFGWAPGNPEEETWNQPSMLDWLRTCALNRDGRAVALHEYSLSVDDIENGYPNLVGRYKLLFSVCDQNGIPRPNCLISELGWTQDRTPNDTLRSMSDIDKLSKEYAPHPQILGGALWYLGRWHSPIDSEVQRLIQPVTDFTLATTYEVDFEQPIDPDPEIDPPPPPNTETNLWYNGSFEKGRYHPDSIPELQLPLGKVVLENGRPTQISGQMTKFWFATSDDLENYCGEECFIPSQDGIPHEATLSLEPPDFGYCIESNVQNPHDSSLWARFVRPEIRMLPASSLPPNERPLYVLHGDHVLKVFKGNGSWSGGFIQDIMIGNSYQIPQGTYQFYVPVFADLVKSYEDGTKVWADDPQGRDGLYRFALNGEEGDWKPLVPGTYQYLVKQIEHDGGPIKLGIDFMCPFPLVNSGLFIDDIRLVEVDPEEPRDSEWDVITDVRTTAIWCPQYRDMTEEQIDQVVGWARWGFVLNNNSQTSGEHGISPSHVDVLRDFRDGLPGSVLGIAYPHLIGTGVDDEWLFDNIPNISKRSPGVYDVEPGKMLLLIGAEGGGQRPFEATHWPTPHKIITQAFGANPQYYQQFGLPGHEGLDIRAATGDSIYAIADGVVSRIHTNPDTHAYGIHVRVRHVDGYTSIYGHNSRLSVQEGQQVSGGQIIAYAGNTGNSFGAHLHLTMKHDDAYVGGSMYQGYPSNIINPEPYLLPLMDDGGNPPPPGVGECVFGIHASADSTNLTGDVDAMNRAKFHGLKLLSSHDPHKIPDLVNAMPQKRQFVIRMFLSMNGRDVPPTHFVNDTISDTRRTVQKLMDMGVSPEDMVIEIANEPNLTDEGKKDISGNGTWWNGADFAVWYIAVAQMVREQLPGFNIAFPGLSPGADLPDGRRIDHRVFMRDSAPAIGNSDYLCIHSYFSANYDWRTHPDAGLALVDEAIRLWPSKPIILSESCNNTDQRGAEYKAREYVDFWRELKKRPQVKGVYWFVISASNPAWGWETGSGEVWTPVMADIAGNRQTY